MFSQESLMGQRDRLLGFAARLTGNSHDAEDLLQSTFLRALEKQEYYKPGTSLFTWTSKVMFNIFVSQYCRKKKADAACAAEEAEESMAPTQEMTADLLKLNRCMQRLSNEHRDILALVCIQGLRYEEVSASLGISVGTVRSRLSRARAQLQAMLEDRGFAPPSAAALAANGNGYAGARQAQTAGSQKRSGGGFHSREVY